jgi:hypothetical protein
VTGRTIRAVLWMPRGARISGGHRIQLEETARALETYNVDARVDLDLDVDLSGVDIVHGFSVYPSEVHHCRSRGLPVVSRLSTGTFDTDRMGSSLQSPSVQFSEASDWLVGFWRHR